MIEGDPVANKGLETPWIASEPVEDNGAVCPSENVHHQEVENGRTVMEQL